MSTSQSNDDHLMHKNQLQEYTQKSDLPLPIYDTINEGFPHAPKFRASVLVDGTKYTSELTFLHRKAAEQDVAKLAYECITKMVKDEGCPLVPQDLLLCKSIMHEFAVKSELDNPTYTTTDADGSGQVFVSSLAFNGKTYTGKVGGSKKVAEQLAAHTTIQSLLESDPGVDLHRQIVKSKGKLKSSFQNVKVYSGVTEKVLPIAVPLEKSLPQPPNMQPPIAHLNSCGRTTNPSSWGKLKLDMKENANENSCSSTSNPSSGGKRKLEDENGKENWEKKVLRSVHGQGAKEKLHGGSDED